MAFVHAGIRLCITVFKMLQQMCYDMQWLVQSEAFPLDYFFLNFSYFIQTIVVDGNSKHYISRTNTGKTESTSIQMPSSPLGGLNKRCLVNVHISFCNMCCLYRVL